MLLVQCRVRLLELVRPGIIEVSIIDVIVEFIFCPAQSIGQLEAPGARLVILVEGQVDSVVSGVARIRPNIDSTVACGQNPFS